MLGPRSCSPVPSWTTTYIPRTGYLCHCPELTVASAEDADGQVWYLLGLAIQSEAGRPEPVDEITTATHDTIQDLYQTWAGRWVLIGAGELHMDSSGLLGCFYTLVGYSGGATEEHWVSSSAALLAEVSDIDRTPTRNILHGEGFDWYTPPRSRFESIRRLLPSQLLMLADGNILPRRLFPELSETFAYDDILERLRGNLATVLRGASATSGDLRLALSAGYDSRLLLAAARYAGVPVKTYTQVYPGISQADLTLPPELARAVGLTHSFYSEGTFREDLAAMYDRHTAGHSVDRDRHFISHGQFDWGRRGDTLLLRGGALGAGKAVFWRKFPREESRPTLPDVETMVRRFGYEGATEGHPLVSALGEWIDWTHRTPHPELDWRDRLYLEQKLGGWLSSIEQSLDLIDAVSLQPANSGSYYAHVLQVPPAKRCTGQHHVDLIGSMAPELLAFPFSPFKGSGIKDPTGELKKENRVLAKRNSQLEKRKSRLEKRKSRLEKRNSQLEKRNSKLIARYSSRRYKLVETLLEKVLQVPGVKKLVQRKPAR